MGKQSRSENNIFNSDDVKQSAGQKLWNEYKYECREAACGGLELMQYEITLRVGQQAEGQRGGKESPGINQFAFA